MKYKTSKLTGEALNQAVANAAAEYEGVVSYADYCGMWEYGGRIIDRFGIAIHGRRSIADPLGFADWHASIEGDDLRGINDVGAYGPTALVAAMRAFVTAKLGTEVDL